MPVSDTGETRSSPASETEWHHPDPQQQPSLQGPEPRGLINFGGDKHAMLLISQVVLPVTQHPGSDCFPSCLRGSCFPFPREISRN